MAKHKIKGVSDSIIMIKVCNFISDYYTEHGVFPNDPETARKTGVDVRTVKTIIKKVTKSPDLLEQYKLLAVGARKKLYDLVQEGNLQAIKLYFEYIADHNYVDDENKINIIVNLQKSKKSDGS